MFWNKKTKVDLIDISHISKLEQQDIKRIFARTFSTEDGKKALAYLQYFICHRSLPAETSHEALRYMEGQRALVSTIQRFTDQGKTN